MRVTDGDSDDGVEVGVGAEKTWRRLMGFKLIPLAPGCCVARPGPRLVAG